MSKVRLLLVFAAITVSSATLSFAGAGGPCRDPWVDELIREWRIQNEGKHRDVVNGVGEDGECNIKLYGQHWSGKDELRRRVDATMRALAAGQLEYRTGGRVATYKNCVQKWVAVDTRAFQIGPDGSFPRQDVLIRLPNNYVLTFSPVGCRKARPE